MKITLAIFALLAVGTANGNLQEKLTNPLNLLFKSVKSFFGGSSSSRSDLAPAPGYYRPAPAFAPAYNLRPTFVLAAPARPAPVWSVPARPALISNNPGSNSIVPEGHYALAPPYAVPGAAKPDIIAQEAAEHPQQDGAAPHEAAASSGHAHFGYDKENGPEKWAEHYPACGGKRQSPIDINVHAVTPKSFPPIVFSNYYTPPKSMVVKNNGHSIEVSGDFAKESLPSIIGGPLNEEYIFQQMHLHWGKNDTSGSEHTVNGESYPMEMHVVHYNGKYGDFASASSKPDGLTVMGFFFVIGEKNVMLEKIARYGKEVEGSAAKNVEMNKPLPIGVLNLECDDNNWVTYQGSLTTPPCSEVVTWINCMTPNTLSSQQMFDLRNVVMDSHEEAFHNYRPTMPLNGRNVYYNVA